MSDSPDKTLPAHERSAAFERGWRDSIIGKRDDEIPRKWGDDYDRGWKASKDRHR